MTRRCPDCQHEVCNCNRYTYEQVYGKGHVHNWVFLRHTYNYTLDIATSVSGNVFYCSGCLTQTVR